MVVCVFLLKMIEIDMFNNPVREQKVILQVKLGWIFEFMGYAAP